MSGVAYLPKPKNHPVVILCSLVFGRQSQGKSLLFINSRGFKIPTIVKNLTSRTHGEKRVPVHASTLKGVSWTGQICPRCGKKSIERVLKSFTHIKRKLRRFIYTLFGGFWINFTCATFVSPGILKGNMNSHLFGFCKPSSDFRMKIGISCTAVRALSGYCVDKVNHRRLKDFSRTKLM